MSRKVLSVSLPQTYFKKVERLTKKENTSRSELFRNLIDIYEAQTMWNQLYDWGKQTGKEFNIKSEQDILQIIND